MPEHVHLLIVPRPSGDGGQTSISGILAGIKRPVATAALARWRELKWRGIERLIDSNGQTHFWLPGGGFDRNIRDAEEFARTVTYIHQNPVERDLVENAYDYRWSSARAFEGVESLVAIDKYQYGQRWEWWADEPCSDRGNAKED